MSTKDPFAAMNPFLRLNLLDLPSGRSPRPTSEEKNVQKHADNSQSVQDEESRLFLQSVRALPLHKKTSCKTLSLVTLQEHFASSSLLAPEKATLPRAAPLDLTQPPAAHVFPAPQTYEAHDVDASSQEDHAHDFVKAMRDVRPLKNKGRDVLRNVEPPAAPDPPQPSFLALLENTLEFALYFSEEYVQGHVVGLESLILQKLRTGQYSPESHLDLHGLNARQAFDALVGFVRRSWHRGMRTLLLIPGRGKNSPEGVAILRARVQSWLTQDPLKRVVLAFCTARPVDGGPGSLYLLLRKYKKKGKVCWERSPVDLDL